MVGHNIAMVACFMFFLTEKVFPELLFYSLRNEPYLLTLLMPLPVS